MDINGFLVKFRHVVTDTVLVFFSYFTQDNMHPGSIGDYPARDPRDSWIKQCDVFCKLFKTVNY